MDEWRDSRQCSALAHTTQYACPSPNGCPSAENVKPDMHDYGWTDAVLHPSAASLWLQLLLEVHLRQQLEPIG